MISLVLLWTAFLTATPVAHAGHWHFSAAHSTGTATGSAKGVALTQPTWTLTNAEADNTLTVNGPSAGAGDDDTTGPPNCTCQATFTVKIVATWVDDTNSDNTPPTSVWFIETSTAGWTASGITSATPVGGGGGTTNAVGGGAATAYSSSGPRPMDSPAPTSIFTGHASDHMGDPQVVSSADSVLSGVSSIPSSSAKPPPNWIRKDVTDKTVTLPDRVLHADITATYPTGGHGHCTIGATTGPYIISVHAQPYNFRDVGYTDGNGVHHGGPEIDDVGGHLIFHYKWSSTDGDIAHLASCQVGEYLDYSGNTDGSYGTSQGVPIWIYPSPPVGADPSTGNPEAEANPDRKYQAATLGEIGDDLKPPYPWLQSYVAVTWTVNQKYTYNDTATGEVDVIVPGPDAGPFSIVRTVYQRSTHTWRYTVTKSGQTAYCTLP